MDRYDAWHKQNPGVYPFGPSIYEFLDQPVSFDEYKSPPQPSVDFVGIGIKTTNGKNVVGAVIGSRGNCIGGGYTLK